MIIFDLDGTLADCFHRQHFVDPYAIPIAIYKPSENCKCGFPDCHCGYLVNNKGKRWKPNWKQFFEACDNDTPIKPTINAFFHLIEHHKIEIWSGRCESVREKTVKWMHEYCPRFSHCELKMRPIGDSTPDDVLKERWLDEAHSEGNIIEFVFDDRPKVVRMWRRRGIFVFNCAQHDENF